ncbi:hypothetical protein KUCAC02_024749, partial [Chaenocephalus aceratus]
LLLPSSPADGKNLGNIIRTGMPLEHACIHEHFSGVTCVLLNKVKTEQSGDHENQSSVQVLVVQLRPEALYCWPSSVSCLRVGRTRTFSAASSDEPYISSSHHRLRPRTVWPDESMGTVWTSGSALSVRVTLASDCHLEGMGHQTKLKTSPQDGAGRTDGPPAARRDTRAAGPRAGRRARDGDKQGNLGGIDTRVNKAEQYFHQADTGLRHKLLPRAAEERSRADFVSGAKEMCFALWTAGYWADFIDPTTGEAFFASPSSQTKLRTEEELRDLGFHIEVAAIARLQGL